MVNIYVGLMIITATTVGKIMLCSVAGMFVSRYFTNPETSQKGLSYIAMKVFLPCLLFANLCLNVTWEQLSRFYWAPLFAFLPMTLGFLSSVLVSVLLTKEYRFVVILANTFQNGLTFPVSVVLNLKGIDWFTGAAVVNAQSYIFLYNVVCSMGLWAIGDPLIGYAKAKEVEEEEQKKAESEKRARRQRYVDMGIDGEAAASENRSFSYPFESPRHDGRVALTRKHNSTASTSREEAEAREREIIGQEVEEEEGLPEPASPCTAAALQKRAATVREQLGWYKPAHAKDRPIVPPAASPVIMLDGEMGIEDVKAVKVKDERWKRLGHIALKSIQSPPVLSSIVAIVISLTPPLRWLAMSPLGEPFVGGMSLIGEGAIPLQLLVLGSSIAASRPKDDPASPSNAKPPAPFPTSSADADGTVVDVSRSPSAKDGNALVRWITARVPPQYIFTWCAVVTRLIFIPAICFLVLHILVTIGLMPNDKPFLLSMLVGIMSPSAMNSTLICAMHGYHARDYARMIFCMYVSVIFTATVWLFIFVLYLRD